MTAIAAVYEAVRTNLVNHPLTANRAYPDVVQAGVARPYMTWFFVAGGEENAIKKPDARITVTIKCVSNTLDEAFRGSESISTIFNDQGGQEGGLIASAGDWHILTITQGRVVHVVDPFADSVPIYHAGHQFEFVLERM